MRKNTIENNSGEAQKEQYVLDTYAVLCYLRDEEGADLVAALLKAGKQGRILLNMSWINVGEVYYIVQREEGREKSRAILELLRSWPVHLVECTEKMVLAAGDIKAKYPLSYADAFAVALARDKQAFLLTGDPEFEKVEKNGLVNIKWLPCK
ncbi:MAG: type II toxin-antitoxin system VapC family toxin [Bacillota bacterium]